jgi:hypothetical protein
MNEVALRTPAVSLEETKEQVRLIETTEFVPKSLRGNKHAILACILYGRELGLGPMASLEGIHMIDGRPSLAAATKLKRAREAGHSVEGESTDERATVKGVRADNGDTITVTFTIEDARRANLLSKDNWKKYPADMLWSRAISRLCRRLFDDVPGVLMADPDEAELGPEDRVAEAVGAFDPPDTSLGESGAVGNPAVSSSAPQAEGRPLPRVTSELEQASDSPSAVEDAEVVEAQGMFPIPEKARHVDHG